MKEWNGYEAHQTPLLYVLWTWRCTIFNSIPSILILLTNKNFALINYPITICWTENKGLCTIRELPIQTGALLFLSLMIGAFQTNLHHYDKRRWRKTQSLRLHKITFLSFFVFPTFVKSNFYTINPLKVNMKFKK